MDPLQKRARRRQRLSQQTTVQRDRRARRRAKYTDCLVAPGFWGHRGTGETWQTIYYAEAGK